jgi:hypothetical protein
LLVRLSAVRRWRDSAEATARGSGATRVTAAHVARTTGLAEAVSA